MAQMAWTKHKAWKLTKKYLFMLLIVFKWIFILFLVCGIFGGAAAFGYFSSLVQDDPIRDKSTLVSEISKNTLTGFVYFNDETTAVGQLRGIDRRLVENLSEVPKVVQNAVLAIEDHDFYEHFGVDIGGFLRAVKEQLLNEAVQTGGSTITQQVARNVFLTLDRSVTRKAKELLLAVRLERHLSKEEIFLAYLNKVPFGNGSSGYNVYGIKAAAKGIFDLDRLEDIHLAQAAYLAGLPQDPNDYSAFDGYGRFDESGFEEAVDRQRLVLRRMLTVGSITQAEYEAALEFDLKASIAASRPKAYSTYPFLMIEAETKAAELLILQSNPEMTIEELRKDENIQLINNAREDMLGKGYRIYTTIDKSIYESMSAIAKNPENFSPDHEEKGVEQVGAIMLDNATGAILGMIEGRDFHLEQMNHATQMIRQPGSTMKPIAAFLPAMEQGLVQPASIVEDSPIILEDGGKGYHLPNNWNYRFQGLVTARHALNQSLNIPALRLFNDVVGIDNAWAFAKELGITTITEQDHFARTGVIGGLAYGTTVEELANAYMAIPTNGVFRDAYMIKRIEDSEGNIIFEHEVEDKKVFSPETSYLMTDMLKTVITSGTGSTIKSTFEHYGEIEVAGKTGSTQNDYDAWFMGYSPEVTVGVWAGYDQPSTLLLNQGAGHRAKNIWSMIMDQTIELKPELFDTTKFERPENIVNMTVSSISGKLPTDKVKQLGRLTSDMFNRKYIPTSEDDNVVTSPYVRYNGLNYLPSENAPADMVKEKTFITRELNIYETLSKIDQILKDMPTSQKPRKRGVPMTVKDFYPEDIALTAPELPMPAAADSVTPNPPTQLKLTAGEGNNYTLTFTNSDSPNVLGYRFYRSVNGSPFSLMSGKVVAHGDYAAFYVQQSPNSVYAYYLTSVDASGTESAPSEIVSSDPDASGDLPFPFFPGGPDSPDDGDGEGSDPDGDGNGNGNGNGNADGNGNGSNDEDLGSLPSQPQNVEVVAAEDGMSAIISWSANPSSDSINQYEVYYSSNQEGPFSRAGWSNTTQFRYITLPLEGWYQVVAVNGAGSSSPSAPVQFTSQAEE